MYLILAKRIARMVLVALGAVLLAFIILNLSGDPAAALLPPDAPPESVEAVRIRLGLDKPLWTQFGNYVLQVAQGDFGYSYAQRRPAIDVVLERLPATYELIAAGIFVALAVSVPLGLAAGVRPRSRWEKLAETIELAGQAIPSFWLGIILILFLGVQWQVLPVSGRGSLLHLVLPSITLASFVLPAILRTTRFSVREVTSLDYIRTARAKGLPGITVILRHVLGNALVPIVAVSAFQLSVLIGGAAVVETVFSWPGVGRAMVQAIHSRDFPVVQAGVLLFALQMVIVNLLVDFWHAALDPRVRAS